MTELQEFLGRLHSHIAMIVLKVDRMKRGPRFGGTYCTGNNILVPVLGEMEGTFPRTPRE